MVGLCPLGALAALVLLAPLSRAQAVFPEIQSLVVFGDSLSDTGRAGGIVDTSPPGLVWVDYLAAQLGIPEATPYNGSTNPNGRNFAIFGTTAGMSGTLPFPDGASQIALYLEDEAVTPPADALIVLWLGTLDLYSPAVESTPEAAADRVFTLAQTLANAGGRQFLLPNMMPLGLVPANASEAAAWDAISTAFNQRLAIHVANLRTLYPEAVFIPVRAYDLFRDFVAHPGLYGFTDLTRQAFVPGIERDDYSIFLWWENYYPTSAAHAHLADFAVAEITAALGGVSAENLALSLGPTGAGGAWELTVTGPGLALLTIEKSTDLVSWQMVRSFVDFDGLEALAVPTPGSGEVFYRAR